MYISKVFPGSYPSAAKANRESFDSWDAYDFRPKQEKIRLVTGGFLTQNRLARGYLWLVAEELKLALGKVPNPHVLALQFVPW